MATNFPANPSNGDTHAGFTFNSATGAWESSAVTPSAQDPAVTVYATVDDLPTSGVTTGQQAFVSATNRLYIWNSSGWYNIALINTTPSISGASASYDLASDGTPTVVTITASDPEGLPITYDIVSDTSGNTATVTSNNNIFTITPSTNDADAGTFSLTFRASDGVNIASAISEFILQFKIVNSNYTTALITSVGTNNEVNNSFVDSSTNSNAITATGNATQTTFSPYRHGGYSTYFDGSGDYLTGPSIVLSNTVPFTIELWYYNTSTGTSEEGLIVQRNGASSPWNGWRIFNNVGSANTLSFYNGTSYVTIATNLPKNQWHHIAVVSQGSGTNQGQCYLNGVASGSAFTVDSLINFNGNLAIGTDNAVTSRTMTGYLADVRVVNGTAVYTSNFTPTTERLTAITNTSLLTCHLPYIADGSTNGHSISVNGNTKTTPFSPYDYETYSAADNGGSIYFDGSGDKLTIPGTYWNFGTNPFTVEAWVYPNSANGPIFTTHRAGTASGFYFSMTTTNNAILHGRYYGSNVETASSANAVKLNQWNHFAWCREGTGSNQTRMFANGKVVATYTDNQDYSSAPYGPFVGGYDAGGAQYDVNGNIADLRVVSGTALYTADFTPPTTPLTAITNTSLLLKGTNAGIIDKSQSVQTLTLNGDAKSSTTQSKYLTSSMYFDGTDDYLEATASSLFDFGSEDFTIEMWAYPQTDSDDRGGLFELYVDDNNVLRIFRQTGDVIEALARNGGVNQFQITSSITNDQWVHYALVNNGGTVSFYKNGTLVGSDSSFTLPDFSSARVLIGLDLYGTDRWYTGYISDVRITKGLARYTSNFTPPTAALQG